jgi:two-component system, OmpR family, sensor kinase
MAAPDVTLDAAPSGSRLSRSSRWSLRTRLVAAMVALLAVVSLVIGLVTVLALRQFLAGKLDDQLYTAAHRSSGAFGGPEGRPADGRELNFLLAPGQAEGTLGALLEDGTVTAAAILDPSGTARPLRDQTVQQLTELPVGTTTTVDLGEGYGDYRVLATSASTGDVLVTGLPMAGVDATTVRLAGIVTLVAAIGLAIAAFVATRIVRWSLKPLNRVANTATRVSELPLDRGEVALAERVPLEDADPDTEVGQVGAALNRMLDHISAALSARQHSETRVRQFVADASHELRTPLASIRGYAELTRRSTEPVPADVAHALGRVESEAVRMTGLVDDLLLLARLDSGRTVERAPVDLSRLVVDATSDARVSGKDHRWDLEVPAEPVVVDGDEAGLHQVVANLLANARAHTPAGTEVRVALAAHGGHAVLSVTDNGPGIPAELQPDVFDRFARGDHSRSRAAGSTGLGLSIVAAVVEAHGGQVGVESRPGRTRFTVLLPANGGWWAPARATGSEQARHTVGTEPTRTVPA